MKLEFGRRISYIPLLIVVVASILIGYFFFTFSNKMIVGVRFAVVCLITGPILYSVNLTTLYGYWRVDDQGIHYYDYGSFGKKIKAILLPLTQKDTVIEFSEIKSFSVFAGKEIKAPEGILGGVFYGYSPDTVLQRFPTAYYFSVVLNNGKQVDLDLSMNVDDTDKIEDAISLIGSKTGKRVQLIKER